MPSIDASTKPRVTQSDVARAAGVHNTTVSLSLRNCSSIPAATRDRIRAIADQLGYYPDPTLQALVAYRKGRVANRPRETLAFVTDGDTRWGWREISVHEGAFTGAQRKAAELGYQLEHFWLREPGMSQRRLSSVLYHRGITGVLLACSGATDLETAEFDWSRLSVVRIGAAGQRPPLHQVAEDHGQIVRLAVRRSLAAGFERVGFVYADWWDQTADQAWSAGFFAEQSRLRLETRIPALRLGGSQADWLAGRAVAPGAPAHTAFTRWYEAHRPEVIVAFSAAVLTLVEDTGLSVPRDLAYVELRLEREDHRVAGVRPNSPQVGEIATSLLVAQTQQNSRGLPAVPTATLVNGTWSEGSSLPAFRLPAAWREGDPTIEFGPQVATVEA